MTAHRAAHSIATLCRVLEVSPRGYYAWHRRPASQRAHENASLTAEIAAIHSHSRGMYGAPRIHAELVARGQRVSRKRIARLMRAAHLRGVSRRKVVVTTTRAVDARPAPDLVRRAFTATGPNQLWVADSTYIPTGRGFLFLAVVLDVWSRRIVGWAMETHLRTTLVLAALDMAVEQRQPRAVIHHSDQGCRYTALAFGVQCRQAGVRPSMGSVGDCYDNALCESFFATLECELLDRCSFPTPAAARTAVFDCIAGWYNTQRRHSALAYDSPLHFEQRHRPQAMPEVPMEAAGPVDAKNTSTSPLENGLRPFPTAPPGDTPALQDTM